MLRSSSAAHIKIDFDLRQAKVGHSSIDKLPIKRTNSVKSISRQSIHKNQSAALQSQQYHLDLLKRLNQSLQRQNSYLKKQLEFYAKTCSMNQPNTNPRKKQDYRDRILSRIDGKNDTESTGMFNSKMNSGAKSIQESISQIYDRFHYRGVMPRADQVVNLVNNYFEEIKDNYHKIKALADSLKSTEEKQVLSNKISLLNPVNLNSKSKRSKQQILDEMFTEFTSPNEIISVFQIFLLKISKNSKLIEKVKSSLNFMKFIKRVNK